MAVLCFLLTNFGGHIVAAEVILFLWAIVSFASLPASQINVVNVGQHAPNLIATNNIGAFNAGNALGAWVGGLVITRGQEFSYIPLAAAAIALVGLGVVDLAPHGARRR